MSRIMIVDDCEDSRIILETLIRDAGYDDVVLVDSAAQAFHNLGVAGGPRPEKMVDLVLLDVDLPELDGINACHRIRQDAHLAGVPIIMVTGLEDDSHLEAAFRAGADDYVRKPVRRMELVARVRAALDRKETAERLLEERADLEFQAGTDTVTGIPRRRSMMRAYDSEWRRAARAARPLAFVMLDLDNFHAYNERYGHLAGDECLRRVASTLAASLRRGGDQVSRVGGEEFGVLLPDADATRALAMGELLRNAVQSLAIPHERTSAGVVTVSVGVASLVPHPGMAPDVLVELADRALFEAKAMGRNRVRLRSLDGERDDDLLTEQPQHAH